MPDYELEITEGQNAGKRFPLSQEGINLGTNCSCGIVLAGIKVEDYHARVEYAGDDPFVKDLATQFGTLVNGKQVREQVLKPNDVITIGLTQLTLISKSGVSQIPPPIPIRQKPLATPVTSPAPKIAVTPIQPSEPSKVSMSAVPAQLPEATPTQTPGSTKPSPGSLIDLINKDFQSADPVSVKAVARAVTLRDWARDAASFKGFFLILGGVSMFMGVMSFLGALLVYTNEYANGKLIEEQDHHSRIIEYSFICFGVTAIGNGLILRAFTIGASVLLETNIEIAQSHLNSKNP